MERVEPPSDGQGHDEAGCFTKGSEKLVSARFRTREVRTALLATADLVDMGFRVVHDEVEGQEKSYIVYEFTGEVIPLERRGEVYEREIEVILPDQLGKALGRPFSRAGAAVL